MKNSKNQNMFPKMEQLVEEKMYSWCTCGNSLNQPWCDGKHKGSTFKPMGFKAEKNEIKALCTCKKTKNPPFCDGSHKNL